MRASRKAKDRRWHLLRSAKRVGLGFLEPELARKVFRHLKREAGGRCEICKRRVKLFADHCHSRRRHRGMLCLQCNSALGLMKDNSERLRRAADYLDRFEENMLSGMEEE
jgi:hypothetical protein